MTWAALAREHVIPGSNIGCCVKVWIAADLIPNAFIDSGWGFSLGYDFPPCTYLFLVALSKYFYKQVLLHTRSRRDYDQCS
jgi:hypothetical protein